jgi:hypothetical protein
MTDTTASSGLSTYSSRPINAEYVSATSQLIGDKIDTITIKLNKNGSPTGTIEIGIFNSDLSIKQLFSSLDAASISTAFTDYSVSLPGGQKYQIQTGDLIGIKFIGGNNKNEISIMRDTDSNDPFDGPNSFHTYYQGKWKDNPTNDLYMILLQSGP